MQERIIRYVVTYVPETGGRTLALSAQGRDTRATEGEARELMETFLKPSGFPRVMTAGELASVAVRPCECWCGSFDPCGVYFP